MFGCRLCRTRLRAIVSSIVLTETEIREALRDCYDSAMRCNIVDLGFVQLVSVTPDMEAPGTGVPGVPQKHSVSVILTLANPDEGSEAEIVSQVTNRLAGLEMVGQSSVYISDEPKWTPSRISPAGRRLLGLDGNPQLIQIR